MLWDSPDDQTVGANAQTYRAAWTLNPVIGTQTQSCYSVSQYGGPTHQQHVAILWQQGLDVSQQSQAGENSRIIMVYDIPPGLLEDGFSPAHEELHWLLDETVQHVRMVRGWDHLLHQLHLTLDQPQEHRRGYHECGTAFQLVVKQAQSASLGGQHRKAPASPFTEIPFPVGGVASLENWSGTP